MQGQHPRVGHVSFGNDYFVHIVVLVLTLDDGIPFVTRNKAFEFVVALPVPLLDHLFVQIVEVKHRSRLHMPVLEAE